MSNDKNKDDLIKYANELADDNERLYMKLSEKYECDCIHKTFPLMIAFSIAGFVIGVSLTMLAEMTEFAKIQCEQKHHGSFEDHWEIFQENKKLKEQLKEKGE